MSKMFLETMKNIALERGSVRCVLSYSGEDKYALGISDGTNTPLVMNGTFEELQAKLDSEMPEFLEKIRKEVQEKKAKEEQNRREAEIKAAEEKLRREELAKKAAVKRKIKSRKMLKVNLNYFEITSSERNKENG